MAKVAQKVTLSPSRDIPFDQLVLSQSNVRRIKAGILVEKLPEVDSLAENMQRAALHPLRQFRAFVALREKGQSDKEIAAAFFITPQVVKQRLKCASVVSALLELYAEDEMTLEQLMAFTVNLDHERQVQVWEAIRSSWNKEPYQIRRMLTETSVRASDRRAAFIGVEANEAAGGTMLQDLFQGDDSGWLEAPAPLDLPHGYSHGLRRLSGDPAPLKDDEGADHAKLLAEYRALEEEYEGQDEFPEEIDAHLGELEVAMEKHEAGPLIFDDEEIARAGAFVTLDRYGELAVYRGFVRPEDEPREDADVHSGEPAAGGQGAELSAESNVDGIAHGTVITSAGQAHGVNVPDDEDDGALKPLPERLVMELTTHRTLALREAVGRSPDAAAPEARG